MTRGPSAILALGALLAGLATPSLVALPAAVPATLPTQEPAADAAQQGHGLDLGLTEAEASRIGPDGISYEEALKRALIYVAGARRVGQITTGSMIENVRLKWVEEERDLSFMDVSDETVEARIQGAIEQTRQQDPDIDFWAQVEATGNSPESYRTEVKRTLMLDRMFFPDDPDQWPMEELAIIFEKGKENSMWDSFVQPTYEQFQKDKESGTAPQIDDMMRQLILRPYVLRWMWTNQDIVEPFHGLPEGVGLRVGRMEHKTDDLLRRVSSLVGPVEIERAKTWVDVLWKVRGELRKRGIELSSEDCLKKIEEEKKEYEGSPISYEQVAIEFLGFPSMEVYRQHYRLRQSFRQTLEDPYTKETLLGHLETGRGVFLADGKVDVEVILCAAMSMQNGLFPKEGDPFGAAQERATAAATELANGAEWATVLTKYSDFPERVAGTPQGVPQPRKGRLGPQGRNPLRQFLQENDFSDFLLGTSVGDYMFFEAEPGKVYGPMRGTNGWYIFKVNRRVEPSRELDLEENERHIYLAGDDYLTRQFLTFVDEVMAAK